MNDIASHQSFSNSPGNDTAA